MEGADRGEKAVSIAANWHKLTTFLEAFAERLQRLKVLGVREPLLEMSLLVILKEAVVRFIILLIVLNQLKVIDIEDKVLGRAFLSLFVFFLDSGHSVARCGEASHFHILINKFVIN